MGFFLIIKKMTWEKDFKFVRDVGVTFQMLFNSIINKNIKKNGLKRKGIAVY